MIITIFLIVVLVVGSVDKWKNEPS